MKSQWVYDKLQYMYVQSISITWFQLSERSNENDKKKQ